MAMTLLRGLIAGAIVIGVTELSNRSPRLGALLLTLPLVSILAFVMAWSKHHDLSAISNLARETLVLVPLGLPFFIPFAIAHRTGLSFWPTFVVGVVLASMTIGAWLWLAPGAASHPPVENQHPSSKSDRNLPS
jgi:hypothetical protein